MAARLSPHMTIKITALKRKHSLTQEGSNKKSLHMDEAKSQISQPLFWSFGTFQSISSVNPLPFARVCLQPRQDDVEKNRQDFIAFPFLREIKPQP